MITDREYQQAAEMLGVDVPAIKAVTKVEAPVGGFQPTGEPTILYERHQMYRQLQAKGLPTEGHPPDLVNKVAGGYGKYSEQHAKLARAVKIDRDSALESCSWGMFQIMGYHWKLMGYPTLQAFVNAMYASEGAQMDAFCRFIKAQPTTHAALKAHDWAKFARLYNGPGYAKNKYDVKLEKAYAEASG
ncbi:endolysin [Pseudomonas phage vB_PaeM_VL12]|uniref:N-acetylmuramidase domain-containing protein n=11 Tax=Nankokuvirus TaxID=1925779 RepID=A0A0K0L9F9_9CAUD|nr:N-acetylmuramidase family protein [Pseudomonas aeruginosa]YP_004306777.1 endolysin [Pseudomonas phage KPP10]YP_008856905.1 endolysin [Pseudomonas phage PAK_P5]YP_008857663.1 endolysin [Pseudomonas phage PAK_P3]YP_008858051.1 endolysin [Pseudomonas phage CHA_P1]YP_009206040.1 endolysin [Pseudomonas phage vB_PaeM_PS24]YP_009604705.1 endolysin [Pseudomonas phage vB_PaeM_G1]ADX32030.1 hypothetical protein P3_CHA0028 [Pseudomonas phage P3_CHA]QIQ63841.1 hypothetical protein Epa24_00075 [Pseud